VDVRQLIQTTVAKYLANRRRPPSQGWKTFLRNHTDAIASIDLFVVPTISFRPLYGFLVLRHFRQEILWLGVTAHPSAEWIARQLTEACGWSEPPQYIIRDRDDVWRCFHPTSWSHGHTGSADFGSVTLAKWIRRKGHRLYPPRLPGSCRCLREQHLRHLLSCYQRYYNEVRPHLALHKDAPIPRESKEKAACLANARRTSPLVRPSLSFRQGQPSRA
jgi:hypothetical protein